MSALGAKADIGSVFLWATTASDASGLDEAILSLSAYVCYAGH